MSLSSKSLAYGVPSLLISAVRLPASSNVVSTPLALSIALLAIPPTGERWDTTDIPYLTLALAHVIVVIVRASATLRAAPSHSGVSARLILYVRHAAHTFRHFLCVDA